MCVSRLVIEVWVYREKCTVLKCAAWNIFTEGWDLCSRRPVGETRAAPTGRDPPLWSHLTPETAVRTDLACFYSYINGVVCGFYLWWLVALNSVFVRAFHVVCVAVVRSFSSLTRLLCGWPVSRFGLMSVQLWTFFYVFFGEHTCTFLMGDTYVRNCQIVGYVNIQVYFTLAIIF